MQHGVNTGDANGQAMGLIGQMIRTASGDHGLYRRVLRLRHRRGLMIPLVLFLVRRVQVHGGRAAVGH